MMKLSSGGGVSLRAGNSGGWVFPPAIMNVTPAYFCRKMEEKQNKTKSLAVWFPIYLNDLPSYLKFKQRPV